MRIVYLSDAILPSRTANSLHIMKMAQALALNGHEVTLVVPDRPGVEPGVADVHAFYGVRPCFHVVRRPWLKRIKGHAYLYGALAALHARHAEPDLVYARHLPACYAATLLGLSVIFERHMPIEDSGRVSAWMFPRMIRRPCFRRLVVITEALRDYILAAHPCVEGRILVAPDGADPLDDLAPAPGAGAGAGEDGRLRIGYVGHLYRGKGMELIVELAKRCPWAAFHIVGGTAEDVRTWRARLPADGNVRLHGFLPHREAQARLVTFDVALAPYSRRVEIHGHRGDIGRWMSPLKLFEYMAAGRPILCSDLPVLREVLEDGETALLRAPEDLDGWAAALVRLRDDPGLRRRLGEAARREFLARYTWRARARRVLE